MPHISYLLGRSAPDGTGEGGGSAGGLGVHGKPRKIPVIANSSSTLSGLQGNDTQASI